MTKKKTPAAEPRRKSSGTGLQYLVRPVGFDPSTVTRVCNSTSTEPLRMADYRKTPARPGSEDFLRWPSKGA